MGAVHSMGRAGGDNASTATLKANIIKIAKRKGFTRALTEVLARVRLRERRIIAARQPGSSAQNGAPGSGSQGTARESGTGGVLREVSQGQSIHAARRLQPSIPSS